MRNLMGPVNVEQSNKILTAQMKRLKMLNEQLRITEETQGRKELEQQIEREREVLRMNQLEYVLAKHRAAAQEAKQRHDAKVKDLQDQKQATIGRLIAATKFNRTQQVASLRAELGRIKIQLLVLTGKS